MRPEDLKVFPSSDELQKAQEQGVLVLRVRAADALLTHYEVTHGTVGEHDHHCPVRKHKSETTEPFTCTCGWSVAEWAIERYEEGVLASTKG
jgi:hypothetical protein